MNGARWCAVGAAIVVLVLSAPPAAAVTPPPVDNSLLPPPGPATPSWPTERHDNCFAAIAGSRPPVPDSSQFDGLSLPTVWSLTRGAGQAVAVIDTGVSRHRLLPRLIPGGDYVSGGDGSEDCDGHGTIVAGIIAATGDAGAPFTGVAPDAAVIGIRQSSNKFRPAGPAPGTGVGDVDTLAKAVRTAADLGATVINVSSVACVATGEGLDDRALGAALAYAVDDKNVVVVAAAGNVGGPGGCPEQNPASDPAAPGQPNWDAVKAVVSPAWYDDLVLTVGSVDAAGAPSRFTLAGPWVDVAAPGENVVSLDPDGDGLIDALPGPQGPKPISGTSYAAPVVSAVAALVRARWPRLTARQVMQRIEDTARPPSGGWDPFVGNGIVDALAAASGDPSPSRTPDRPARGAPPPVYRPSDDRRSRIALGGTAICVAVAVVVVALSARRRGDHVTND